LTIDQALQTDASLQLPGEQRHHRDFARRPLSSLSPETPQPNPLDGGTGADQRALSNVR
jgi:hypothetical protein